MVEPVNLKETPQQQEIMEDLEEVDVMVIVLQSQAALELLGKVLMVVTSLIYLAQVGIFFQHYLVVLVSVTALIYKLKPQLDLRTLSMAPS